MSTIAIRERKREKEPPKSASSVVVGMVQMKAAASCSENLAKAMREIERLAERGAQVISLQELFLSRYFPQSEDVASFQLAETIPGPTTEVLSKAAGTKKVVIVASLFEKRAQGIYHNTAVVFDADGRLAGKYRKMHIPDDPGFYEKFYFTPGDLGFRAFETRYAKVGVLVCWDQWFPEAARVVSLDGAQILFYPTAIGARVNEKKSVVEAQRSAWETVQRAHAIQNGIYVVAVNRVGLEGNLRFWGSTFVADPFGGLVARASAASGEALLADCDLAKIEETRQHWPFLRDRRIDAYGSLGSVYRDAGS
jgi:N-carbamoylputrescine amidase